MAEGEQRPKRQIGNCPEMHVLVVGRGATGKSSLINALLGEEVCPSGMQPNSLTQSLTKNTWKYGDIKINLYDSRGLFNDDTEESLVHMIKRARPGCDYDIILVCMKSTDRFDHNDNKKVFQVVDKISPDVWSKVHVALTHTDAIRNPGNASARLDEFAESHTRDWIGGIKGYIFTELEVDVDIPFHSTSHLRQRVTIRLLNNWLPRFMLSILCKLFTFPTALTIACSHPVTGAAVIRAITKDSSRILFNPGLYDWVEVCKKRPDAGCQDLCKALREMKHMYM